MTRERWQRCVIAFSVALFLSCAMRVSAQQLDSVGVAPTVAIPTEWIDSLAHRYAASFYEEQGYCLTVEQRADTFLVRQITTPRSVRVAVIRGKVGGIAFSCAPGQPTLHTHPDSLCAPGGHDCEFVPAERRHYPSLADLHALKASGAPFDIIQYGPRDFWIYQLAPDALAPPRPHASSLGAPSVHATPLADTTSAHPRAPLDSLDRLRTVLDSLLFERDLVSARIDSIETHKGARGRAAVVLPPPSVSAAQDGTTVQPAHGRSLGPLPYGILLDLGAEVGGRADHDRGGYDRSRFYASKFVMHFLGGCAVEQLAESAHVPRWLAVTGTIAAAIRFESVQGYFNRRDVANGTAGALSCATWSLAWR